MTCASHTWTGIEGEGGQIVGYQCRICSAAESVARHAERETMEADAKERRRYREEPVPWTCERREDRGCGVVLHLPRYVAEARQFCCPACAKRREQTEPCGACADSANAVRKRESE